MGQVTDPMRVAAAIDAEAVAAAQSRNLTERVAPEDLHALHQASAEVRQRLAVALADLRRQRDRVRARPERWVAGCVDDVLAGRIASWSSLETESRDLQSSVAQGLARLGLTAVSGADSDRAALRHRAEALRTHLESGGKIRSGILKPAAQKAAAELLLKVRVDGRPCDSIETIDRFLCWVRVEEATEHLRARWQAHADLGRDATATRDRAVEELAVLTQALDLRHACADLAGAAAAIPDLIIATWNDSRRVEGIEEALIAVDAEERASEASAVLADLQTELASLRRAHSTSLPLARLNTAVEARDPARYAEFYETLVRANHSRELVDERDALLERLRDASTALARELEGSASEESWDARLVAFREAWNHARASAWIATLSEPTRMRLLAAQLAAAEDAEKTTLASLGAELAWRHCFNRMTNAEAQHLNGYALAMRQYGKGTGKYAVTHRQSAREHLDKCQSAIPAWIMPIYRVVDTVPARQDLFDVVIVDEASQSGVEALVLMYLARQVVVVGDDRQISPDAVGIDQSEIQHLQNEYLFDIPLRSALGVQNSFFDQATARYGGRIPLREHFRCMPEIIAWSNQFYPDQPLIPLRQFGADRLEPLMPVHVQNGYAQGGSARRVNPPEADAIVDQIAKCCADPRYDDKTFGVISLVGDAQAKQISAQLLDRIGPDEYVGRRIKCGNAYDFQGDERDVTFLSMVSAPATDRRHPAFTDKRYAQRFNVAVSRARDQAWLFHSVTTNDLNPDCFRHKLLTHFYRPSPELDLPELNDVRPDVLVRPFESLFEQRVFLRIRQRGYRVVPQYEVHGYRIDLVVVGGAAKLAVECDGDFWHGPEQYERDATRQRDLERCHWEFFRVTESLFYLGPDAALAGLWELLETRGIWPVGHEPPPPPPSSSSSPSPITTIARSTDLVGVESPTEHSQIEPTEVRDDDDLHDVDSDGDDELDDASFEVEDDESQFRVPTVHSPTPASLHFDSTARAGRDAMSPTAPGRLIPLQPYRGWEPTKARYPDPRTASVDQLVDALVEIVLVEGPVLAERAYRLLMRAAGFQRLTKVAKHPLNRAAHAAARRGLIIEELPPGHRGQSIRVLRAPGTAPVLTRERGPREFDEVPDSELTAAIRQISNQYPRLHGDDLKRAVLDLYELRRLTAGVSLRLDSLIAEAQAPR